MIYVIFKYLMNKLLKCEFNENLVWLKNIKIFS